MLDDRPIPPNVQNAFDAMPPEQSTRLKNVRQAILRTAEEMQIGPLTETLKWGQPSYLTEKGTTLRLGQIDGQAAVMVHCQSSVIDQARQRFDDVAAFSGNRAVIAEDDSDALDYVIRTALTYHRR